MAETGSSAEGDTSHAHLPDRAALFAQVESIHDRWAQRNSALEALCISALHDARTLGESEVALDMLRRLSAIADERGDTASAQSLLADAAALAVESPYLQALIHRDHARLLPNTDGAHVEHLLEAAQKFEEAADLRSAAAALLDAGDAQGTQGSRERAVDLFVSAQVMARQVGDAVLSARADDRLAAAYWELGRGDLAERHLREALTVLVATGKEDFIAQAQFRLGWFLADHDPADQADEALWLLERARLHAQAGERLGLVAACDEKASWVKAATGEIDDAIGLMRKAVTVFRAVGDDYSSLVAECNLAGQLISVDRADEGLARYRSVLSRANEMGNHHLRATVSTRLADELAQRGAGEEALEILGAVADYFEHDDNTVEATNHILATAAAHRALSNVRATHECAERALDRLDRAVLPSLHARALEYIAECLLYDGNKRGAEALFGQAVALYLVDDELDKARRVAQQILPESPRQRPTSKVSPPQLTTGLYL